MSSRETRKAEARRARLEAQAQEKQQTTRRKRIRTLGGVLLIAAATVAVSVAVSSGNTTRAGAASGGRLTGAALSSNLFAGVPQRGNVIGNPHAPVRLVEFADLQCPYCDEYTLRALPTLVKDYVRTGEVQMQFENLSFIGSDSVAAGRVAAAAAKQGKLWNFVDLLYLNQGEENTGYVTPTYVRRLLDAIPGLNVSQALGASRTAGASAALTQANQVASQYGIDATPSFLIGRTGGALHQFQPSSLTAQPFMAALHTLLGRGG